MRGLKDDLEPDMVLYADLPRMRSEPQTTSKVLAIPDSILVTSAHPDIVIIEQNRDTLIELTILHNSLDHHTRQYD